jgi:hypothetical protein
MPAVVALEQLASVKLEEASAGRRRGVVVRRTPAQDRIPGRRGDERSGGIGIAQRDVRAGGGRRRRGGGEFRGRDESGVESPVVTSSVVVASNARGRVREIDLESSLWSPALVLPFEVLATYPTLCHPSHMRTCVRP